MHKIPTFWSFREVIGRQSYLIVNFIFFFGVIHFSFLRINVDNKVNKVLFIFHCIIQMMAFDIF